MKFFTTALLQSIVKVFQNFCNILTKNALASLVIKGAIATELVSNDKKIDLGKAPT